MENNMNRKRLRGADQQQLVSPPKRSRVVPISRESHARRNQSVGSNSNNNTDININGTASRSPRDGSSEEETSSSGDLSDEETDSADDTSSYSSSSSSSEENDNDNDNSNIEQDNHIEQPLGTDRASTDISLPHIRGRPKPRIHRINQNSDILSRLSSFLPKLKDANEDLQREIAAGRAKDVRLDEAYEDEEGQYIEMDLGLGVLEEKRNDNDASDSENEDEDEDEDESNQITASTTATASTQSRKFPKDSNVLDRLMGNNNKATKKKKPAIEEIGD